jgi:hypothetical protein
MNRYYVPFSDQRDLDCHASLHAEMTEHRVAFERTTRCEVCGAKPTSTKRHAGGAIVVSCSACVGKRPTPHQLTINRSHASARARLAEVEKRLRTL